MSVSLIGREPGGSIGIQLSDGKISVGESDVYIVQSTIRNEAKLTVLMCSGLPIIGITTTAAGAVCSGLDAVQEKKQPHIWRVTTKFTAEPSQTEDPGSPGGGPLTWIPIWKGVLETEDDFTEIDASGRRIVNSAGVWFAEPIARKRKICATAFTQYEDPSLTIDEIMDRTETVNDDDFNGVPKWRLKLIVKEFEKGFVSDVECWKIKYECRYKKGLPGSNYMEWDGSDYVVASDYSGWRELRLDVSSHQLVSGQLVPCRDQEKRPIANGFLDGAGVQMAPGSNPKAVAFDRLPEIDFSSFLRV